MQPAAPTLRQIWTHPLPGAESSRTRFAVRLVTHLGRRRILSISGLDRAARTRDPFLLVLNHSQRPEAILVPGRLAFEREGCLVHFLADWSPMLIPGIGFLYRAAHVVPVPTKSARPAILDRFRSRYCDGTPPFRRALALLRSGRSVALFPEGRMNRSPTTLLPGRRGAALLAVAARVPVIPAGILHEPRRSDRRIRDGDPFHLRFGEPILPPPAASGRAPALAASRLHEELMGALSQLSGKHRAGSRGVDAA